MLDFEYLEEAYREFEKTAPHFDFFPRGFHETVARVRGFYLKRPRSRSYQEPGEICYAYEPPEDQKARGNDYKVVICTTKRMVGFVGKDSGWVIIVNGAGERVYSAGPFIRTNPDFFEDLLWEGRVARWRVFYRPDHCDKPMLLVHGNALKSRYWRCADYPMVREHDRRFDDLRRPLPADVMEFIVARRKERRAKRKSLRDRGKDPFAAFRLRMKHPWEKEPLSSEIEF